MPSTVYKGDLAEVAFGTEAGMLVEHGFGSAVVKLLASSNDGSDTSIIEVSGGAASTPVVSGILEYPKGMLVGSRLVLMQGNNAATKISASDDYNASGRIFTIVEFLPDSGNTRTRITVTPKLLTTRGADVTLDTTGSIGDRLEILPYKTPALDTSMTFNDAATTSDESVLTDQFLGLTSALTLPETKVDLKRFHVVGLGRDVSVQAPGKFITEGGSFEVAMHSARWLKYCLGQELVYNIIPNKDQTTVNTVASNAGDSHLDLSVSTASIYYTTTGGNATLLAVGDYVYIKDTTDVDIVSDHEPDAGSWDGAWGGTLFDKAEAQEVRRIVAMSGTRIWLNEPLQHSHGVVSAHFIRYQGVATNIAKFANPFFDTTAKGLVRSVNHLLYSKAYVPSFALECSIRRRDVNSDIGAVDGSAGDSKELTRVFRGCKVSDFTLTTDNDAALRLSVNFNSALCYTDTGRLETTNPHSRFAAHRMFDDTAATEEGRYIAGIGKGTQKPFMFYNGSIEVAGQQVAQVLNFTLTGQTGMQSFYAINGNAIGEAATDQVPFGGARNVHTMVEGQTTYEMSMEIIVDDPFLYHKMRTSTEFFQDATKQVVLDFQKTVSSTSQYVESGIVINNGGGYSATHTGAMTVDGTSALLATGIGETLYKSDGSVVGVITAIGSATSITMGAGTVTSVANDDKLYYKALPERLSIVMDDYYIVEAPLQIPEDKGPIKSTLKIMPKSIKAMSRDSILQY